MVPSICRWNKGEVSRIMQNGTWGMISRNMQNETSGMLCWNMQNEIGDAQLKYAEWNMRDAQPKYAKWNRGWSAEVCRMKHGGCSAEMCRMKQGMISRNMQNETGGMLSRQIGSSSQEYVVLCLASYLVCYCQVTSINSTGALQPPVDWCSTRHCEWAWLQRRCCAVLAALYKCQSRVYTCIVQCNCILLLDLSTSWVRLIFHQLQRLGRRCW